MATEKIDMRDLFDKFLTTYKQKCQCQWATGADRMFKTMV